MAGERGNAVEVDAPWTVDIDVGEEDDGEEDEQEDEQNGGDEHVELQKTRGIA